MFVGGGSVWNAKAGWPTAALDPTTVQDAPSSKSDPLPVPQIGRRAVAVRRIDLAGESQNLN
jgi:hypothetical protein